MRGGSSGRITLEAQTEDAASYTLIDIGQVSASPALLLRGVDNHWNTIIYVAMAAVDATKMEQAGEISNQLNPSVGEQISATICWLIIITFDWCVLFKQLIESDDSDWLPQPVYDARAL